jgi:hypothetical protein
MNRGLMKTIAGLLLLTAILITAGIIIFKNYYSAEYFRFFPALVVIFFAINAVFFLFFYRSVNKPNNQFIRSFMLATVIKLILYLAIVLIYVLSFPESKFEFSITVMLLYLFYTFYDLIIMVNLVKQVK